MEYVLETNGLSKRYRDFTALNGLNMHIPKGSIYGFVGRNTKIYPEFFKTELKNPTDTVKLFTSNGQRISCSLFSGSNRTAPSQS